MLGTRARQPPQLDSYCLLLTHSMLTRIWQPAKATMASERTHGRGGEGAPDAGQPGGRGRVCAQGAHSRRRGAGPAGRGCALHAGGGRRDAGCGREAAGSVSRGGRRRGAVAPARAQRTPVERRGRIRREREHGGAKSGIHSLCNRGLPVAARSSALGRAHGAGAGNLQRWQASHIIRYGGGLRGAASAARSARSNSRRRRAGRQGPPGWQHARSPGCVCGQPRAAGKRVAMAAPPAAAAGERARWCARRRRPHAQDRGGQGGRRQGVAASARAQRRLARRRERRQHGHKQGGAHPGVPRLA